MRYGPNHKAVTDLLDQVSSIEWFSAVEKPLSSDLEAARVDFHAMISKDAFTYATWGGILSKHETPIERLVFDNSLLGAHSAVVSDFKIETLIQDDQYHNLLDRLNETYAPDGSYYADSYTYPHEFVLFPDRLLTWAASEVMVGHLDNDLTFFQRLLPWFERGHWPAGWEGDWPEGQIVVW